MAAVASAVTEDDAPRVWAALEPTVGEAWVAAGSSRGPYVVSMVTLWSRVRASARGGAEGEEEEDETSIVQDGEEEEEEEEEEERMPEGATRFTVFRKFSSFKLC